MMAFLAALLLVAAGPVGWVILAVLMIVGSPAPEPRVPWEVPPSPGWRQELADARRGVRPWVLWTALATGAFFSLSGEWRAFLGEWAIEVAALAILIAIVRRRLTRKATVAISTQGGTQ